MIGPDLGSLVIWGISHDIVWLFGSLHKSKWLVLSALEVVFSMCGCGCSCAGRWSCPDADRLFGLPFVGEVEGKIATLVEEVPHCVGFKRLINLMHQSLRFLDIFCLLVLNL